MRVDVYKRQDPGASIVYGQKTKNKEELQEMINQDKWDDIYKKYPVADGNFVYLPAGCLHAMGKGLSLIHI